MSIVSYFSFSLKAIQISLWPLLLGISLWSFVMNTISFLFKHISSVGSFLFSFSIVFLISILWWKDMVRESLVGYHTMKLEHSMRMGMLLFILSEVFFFISFFWSFFDSSISPTIEYGLLWPPKGVDSVNPFSVPLLNTVILLSSGVSITWSHHSLMAGSFNNSFVSLTFTIFLGAYFLYMQYEEYCECSFSISDGVFGSIFFIATGFHGMHVLVGSIFMLYVNYLIYFGKMVFNHHFSFEACAWYWHFVDVVWLFLFIVVYIWFQ